MEFMGYRAYRYWIIVILIIAINIVIFSYLSKQIEQYVSDTIIQKSLIIQEDQ